MGHPFQGGRTDGPWTDTDVASLATAFARLMGDRKRGWVPLDEVCSTSGLPKDAVEKLAPFARLTVYGDTVHEGRLRVKDIRRMAIVSALAPARRALHEAEIVQSLIPIGFGTNAPLREVHDALADDQENFVSDGRGLWQMRQVLGDTVEDSRADHPNLPPPMSSEEILERLTTPGASFRHDRVPLLQGLSASADGFQRAAAERLQQALARLPSGEPSLWACADRNRGGAETPSPTSQPSLSFTFGTSRKTPGKVVGAPVFSPRERVTRLRRGIGRFV